MIVRAIVATLAALTVSGCQPDESVSAFAPDGAVFVLSSLDGGLPAARTTLTFPKAGEVAGQGPCNSYSGSQTAPYPWIDIQMVLSTRMACPSMALERRYFQALEQVQFAEVSGTTLILSNDGGLELVFRQEN